MGSSKALCLYRGETFAGRLARLFASDCGPVVIVTGAQASLTAPPALTVHNPLWAQGQITSLQAGLRAMAGAPAAFFCPVDCPAFESSTIVELWQSFTRQSALLTIPRFEGRRGHPVLVSQALFAEFLAVPADGQAREVVHAHRDQTHYVDVNDPGILADFDTPEALQSWGR